MGVWNFDLLIQTSFSQSCEDIFYGRYHHGKDIIVALYEQDLWASICPVQLSEFQLLITCRNERRSYQPYWFFSSGAASGHSLLASLSVSLRSSVLVSLSSAWRDIEQPPPEEPKNHTVFIIRIITINVCCFFLLKHRAYINMHKWFSNLFILGNPSLKPSSSHMLLLHAAAKPVPEVATALWVAMR